MQLLRLMRVGSLMPSGEYGVGTASKPSFSSRRRTSSRLPRQTRKSAPAGSFSALSSNGSPILANSQSGHSHSTAGGYVLSSVRSAAASFRSSSLSGGRPYSPPANISAGSSSLRYAISSFRGSALPASKVRRRRRRIICQIFSAINRRSPEPIKRLSRK